MIFTKEDYMWIFALGDAMVISALSIKMNILMFVGIILIFRGSIGLIYYIVNLNREIFLKHKRGEVK